MRVLVVDDSSFVRKALARVLSGVPGVKLVGEAGSGAEALACVATARPDVVTLDVAMPGLDGLATLKELLIRRPELCVIMLSSHTHAGAATTLEALSLGAVDFIDKSRVNVVDFGKLRAELVRKLDVWRAGRGGGRKRAPTGGDVSLGERPGGDAGVPAIASERLAVCVVGASTGGPPAVQALIEKLPASFSLPVVVVQHMPVGFTAAFAARLNQLSALRVSEASDGLEVRAGMVVIAPAGQQLRLDERLVVRLQTDDGERAFGHAPSVDVAMLSAAEQLGERVLGILLTGMGSDGAAGLAAIRAAGGTTVAESEASCVVYGMPRAAIERGAAQHVLALPQIVELLRRAGGPEGASA